MKLADKFKITLIDLFKHAEEEIDNTTIEVESMVGKYWGFPGGENITSEIKKKSLKRV